MQIIMKPTSVIKARLNIEPNGKVQQFLVHTCRVHNDKYVPFRNGLLSTIVIETNNAYIYEQKYAHNMYEGVSKNGNPYNYNKSKHPLACHHWDKVMVSAEMQDIEREVQNYIDRGK